MKLSVSEIQNYCETYSSPAHEVLQQLERETYLKTLAPQMVSGNLQGKLLEFMASAWNASSVLEIGTFTGYGAICLALGMGHTKGKVITLEQNREFEYFHRKYFPLAGVHEKIEVLYGDAKESIQELTGPFDLVFLDAGKQDYAAYYQQIIPKLRSGGLLIADNMLWSGKVITEPNDPDAKALIEFAEMISNDAQVQQIILPVRDGLMMVLKNQN